MTGSQLDSACEYLLKNELEIEADFEIENALKIMLEDGIVYTSDGKYFAVPISEANLKLQQILQASSILTFVPETWSVS